MARRWIRTNRAIAVLGAAVLVLGALVVWRLTYEAGGPFAPETGAERVARQARELLGPRAQVLLVHQGRGRVICGYAAAARGAAGQPFVSRPNRMLLDSDPLSGEFRELMRTECPTLPRGPVHDGVHH